MAPVNMEKRGSLRWRRRRGGAASSPPGRCASSVSIASTDSSTSLHTNDGGGFDCNGRPGPSSLRSLFQFDPLHLRSAELRRERLLALVEEESGRVVDVKDTSHYGVPVQFTDRFHYTAAELAPYRNIGDPEMDEVLEYWAKTKDSGGSCGAFDDVVALAAEEYKTGRSSSPLRKLYKHYLGAPDWVDFDQLQRGIDVFLAYLPAAACSLFYRSLVGGFSIPKIVKVLVATRYIVPGSLTNSENAVRSEESTERDRKRTLERLVDTGGFLACVFAPSEQPNERTVAAASLRPRGRGWEAALQVRVLHAKVRRSLLQSKKADEEPAWDVELNGVPINQEDMAATLLAFSMNVLMGIEIVCGRPLPEEEQRDFLALWRYLGWLLGVDTVEAAKNGQMVSSNAVKGDSMTPIDPCGPRKVSADSSDQLGREEMEDDPIIHANATLESMVLHLLHPEQSSRELVTHLLSLRRFVLFRSEVCRMFLGNPLSDELGIPKSSIIWRGMNRESIYNLAEHVAVKLCMYLFMVYLRWYTLLTMIPMVRRRAIVWHSGLETRFLQAWGKMHAKRMTSAASGKQTEATTNTAPASRSFCPFSMVMPPNAQASSQ